MRVALAPPSAAAAATPTAADAPPLPKVALLFLTRGPMPLEPLWSAFLTAGLGSAWDRLFSVHVHAPPGFAGYPPGSLFEGVLLRTALADPAVTHFVLLSETTVPLYSAAATYLQLASEERSRVNACRNASDPGDARQRMTQRIQPGMLAAGLTPDSWRKSSQWVVLTQPHAQMIEEETSLNAVFAKECWASLPEETLERFCVSDEHYVPTVLAAAGAEGECACDGVGTLTAWIPNRFHPRIFGPQDATVDTLAEELRVESLCKEAAPLESGAEGVLAALAAGEGADGPDDILKALKQAGVAPVPPNCPLFARKIEGSEEWLRLLAPTFG